MAALEGRLDLRSALLVVVWEPPLGAAQHLRSAADARAASVPQLEVALSLLVAMSFPLAV